MACISSVEATASSLDDAIVRDFQNSDDLIYLVSSNTGLSIPIERKIAVAKSNLIKSVLDVDNTNTRIPMPASISDDRTIEIMVEWMKMTYGKTFDLPPRPLPSSDLQKIFMEPAKPGTDERKCCTHLVEFFENLLMKDLYSVIQTSQKLEINDLLHCSCAIIAALCKRKDEKQIVELLSDSKLETTVKSNKD